MKGAKTRYATPLQSPFCGQNPVVESHAYGSGHPCLWSDTVDAIGDFHAAKQSG